MRLNPFSAIKEDNTDRKKQQLEKLIKDTAWDITKKVAMRKCTSKDVDILQNYYKEYFKLYPDKKAELNSNKRIEQLRKLI